MGRTKPPPPATYSIATHSLSGPAGWFVGWWGVASGECGARDVEGDRGLFYNTLIWVHLGKVVAFEAQNLLCVPRSSC